MCEDRVLTLTIHMVRNNSLLGEGKAAIMLQHDLTTAHIALILLLLCPIETHQIMIPPHGHTSQNHHQIDLYPSLPGLQSICSNQGFQD